MTGGWDDDLVFWRVKRKRPNIGCAGTGSGWINGDRISGVSSPTYKWDIPWGYNPLILTIDPNFQRDIQCEPFCLGKLGTNMGHD